MPFTNKKIGKPKLSYFFELCYFCFELLDVLSNYLVNLAVSSESKDSVVKLFKEFGVFLSNTDSIILISVGSFKDLETFVCSYKCLCRLVVDDNAIN